MVPEGTTLAKVVQPGKLKAVLRIPESQAKDVIIGQSATIDTRNGIVQGRVVRKDPSAQGGSVTIDVALSGDLPAGAVPDLSVDGTIQIERLDNVIYSGRPAMTGGTGQVSLFKVNEGGDEAVRVQVELGRSSVNTIEIVRGLQPGDRIILSDMSAYSNTDRVRIRYTHHATTTHLHATLPQLNVPDFPAPERPAWHRRYPHQDEGHQEDLLHR